MPVNPIPNPDPDPNQAPQMSLKEVCVFITAVPITKLFARRSRRGVTFFFKKNLNLGQKRFADWFMALASEVSEVDPRDDEVVTWGEMRALESRLLRRLLAETGARVQGLIEDQVAEDLDIYNAHGAALCEGESESEQERDSRTFCAHNTPACACGVSLGGLRTARRIQRLNSHTLTHGSDGDDGGQGFRRAPS